MAPSLILLCMLLAPCALSAPAPAPAPGPATLYQRPINSDCFFSANASQSSAGGSVNYFPRSFVIGGTAVSTANDRVAVTVATDFSVTYYSNYKVVSNLLVNETYVLYQCGTPAPAANALPAGAKLFSVPLTSVAVLETVPVAFLVQLGVMSRVESVSSYSVAACAQRLLACGKTAPDPLTLTPGALQAAVAPVADAAVVSTNYSGVPTSLAFSASMDPGPLNRAEWVKFLGVFFNLDAVSTQAFNAINQSYYQTRAGVVPAARRPVMAFVQLFTLPPTTAFQVSLAPYKVNYTQDSGAAAPNISSILAINGTALSPDDLTNSTVNFAWNSTTGGFASRAAATAAFQGFLGGVDIVIDETYALDPTTYNYTTFLGNMNLTSSSNYTFIRNRAVFREDGLVGPAPDYGLDWFEGAIARPDLVLLDFARAANQTQYTSRTPTWIRNIARGENVTVISSQNCNQIASCSAAPAPICPFVRACSNGSVAPQQSVNSTCTYETCSS